MLKVETSTGPSGDGRCYLRLPTRSACWALLKMYRKTISAVAETNYRAAGQAVLKERKTVERFVGEAKRRKAEGGQWYEALSNDEKMVAESARQIYRKLAKNLGMQGGCYYCALLLRKFLKDECGISVTPVVGWVTYGEFLFAHSWVEYNGKRIDVSLRNTTGQGVPPGDLLILDHTVEPGQVSYQYHTEATDQIVAASGAKRMDFAKQMRAIAADDARIDRYFLNAPAGLSYDAAIATITAC